MKILIIGGTGLISTAVTKILQARGDHITLFNRGTTPMRLHNDRQTPTLIRGNRSDRSAFELAISEAGTFDAVIDMIAFTPEDVESARRALRGRTGQYVFTSSVDAYAKPYVQHPVKHSHPLGGLTAYGKAKADCERLLGSVNASEFNVTVIRPAHTTGEGGQGLDLFGWNSHYIDRIARGLPVICHGDGTSLWGTCYVDDVARAMVATLGNPRAQGRAYHLAADEVLTWKQIYAATAIAIDGPPPRFVCIPSELLQRALPQVARECAENFLFNNVFDNSDPRQDLGFVQTLDFTGTMRRVHRWLVCNGKLQKAEELPYYDAILNAWESNSRSFTETLLPFDRSPSRLGFE